MLQIHVIFFSKFHLHIGPKCVVTMSGILITNYIASLKLLISAICLAGFSLRAMSSKIQQILQKKPSRMSYLKISIKSYQTWTHVSIFTLLFTQNV